MTRVSVWLRLEFNVTRTTTDDEFFEHVDEVTRQLLNLEKTCEITDSTVSADSGKNHVEIEILAFGADFAAAQDLANSSVRTAIHAAGGATHDWRFTQVNSQATALQDA
jgi:capsid portal protein